MKKQDILKVCSTEEEKEVVINYFKTCAKFANSKKPVANKMEEAKKFEDVKLIIDEKLRAKAKRAEAKQKKELKKKAEDERLGKLKQITSLMLQLGVKFPELIAYGEQIKERIKQDRIKEIDRQIKRLEEEKASL